MKVLISGASIAGPVLAYWLNRYGFEVTVVERAPRPRKTGGHAVDLFRPGMDISERMGVLPLIEAKATGTTRMTVYREGKAAPATIDMTKIFSAVSDRHVEIMRDDLSEVYVNATVDDVEYVFGDSISKIEDDLVSFEHGAARRFDLVVGADGLHSGVRRLVFGDEPEYFIGGYLAVASAPKGVLDGEMVTHIRPGRLASRYGARPLDDERIAFLFRGDHELDYHYRDTARQKEILHSTYAGVHPQVDEWLTEVERTPAFYFDSITQLRMASWSRGRFKVAAAT